MNELLTRIQKNETTLKTKQFIKKRKITIVRGII